jgi:hypothetical protein
MTGAEILAQVRETLSDPPAMTEGADRNSALAALDGCVLLTAEEVAEVLNYRAVAERLGEALRAMEENCGESCDYWNDIGVEEALAALDAKEAGE